MSDAEAAAAEAAAPHAAPHAAPEAERAAAPPVPPTSVPGVAAEAPYQTVTVLRGKRSRRTRPLAAFHGLLRAVANSRGDEGEAEEASAEEEAEAEAVGADSDSDAPTRKRRAARSNVQAWGAAEDAALAALLAAWTARQPASSTVPPPWADLATRLATRRSGKQCRDRYVNHLAPDIVRKDWTDAEERVLAAAYTRLGAKWAALARELPGRTENVVKNHWHATLRCKNATRGNTLRFLKAFQLSLGLGCAVAGAAATAALAGMAEACESEGAAGAAAPCLEPGAPAMPPPARATVLAKLSQPAVATLSTADVLVSLATASGDVARGSRAGSALFAAAASMASADAGADGVAAAPQQPPPRAATAHSAPGAPPAPAARDSAATAEAVLSPCTASLPPPPPDAAAAHAADGAEGVEGRDPRDYFVVSEEPLAPLALLAAMPRGEGLRVREFAVTAAEAQRLTFARGEGASQLAELAAKLHRRCPGVRRVALAMRAGAVAPGQRVYAGAIAASDGELDEAVAFAAERLHLMAKLMREPTD